MIKRYDVLIHKTESKIAVTDDTKGYWCKYEDVEQLINRLISCYNCKNFKGGYSDACIDCRGHSNWELKEV